MQTEGTGEDALDTGKTDNATEYSSTWVVLNF